MSDVALTRDGPVATITLTRPERRNALAPALIAQLTQLFQALSLDDTRVIVLTGEGSAFCAGADIDWMRNSRDLSHEENVADATSLRTMLESIDTCLKPVIARVNGAAMGGGAGLVACADVAIAVPEAKFAFSEARLGLLPSMISPYVLRSIGPGHARALFVTAEVFGAERALELGLVHQVAPAEALDAAVATTVEQLLAGGPYAIAASKKLVRDATASLALPDLPERIAMLRSGMEGQEGLAAFLERRKPEWIPESPES